MPFEISATADLTLLTLRAHGRGTAEEGQRALHAVQAHAAYSQGVAILIDALDLVYTPSAVGGTGIRRILRDRVSLLAGCSRGVAWRILRSGRGNHRVIGRTGSCRRAVHEQVCRTRVAGDGFRR